MNMSETMHELQKFVAERDWSQFHTPENLAKSISIEAAELLECFQWGDPDLDANQAARSGVVEELADVLTYGLLLADSLGVDPVQIVHEKLQKTAQKYPVEKAKGKSDKYTKL